MAFRSVGLAIGGIFYLLGSYGFMAYMPGSPWAMALLFGPFLLGFAVSGLARRQWGLLILAVLGGAGLIWIGARGRISVEQLYVAQHAMIHIALAVTFGWTLCAGRTPLITALAERLHSNFTQPMRVYTHGLTRLWAAFFVAMVVLSIFIYALAPWPWWSFFCVFLTPAAAAIFFVGEYFFRYWRHPEFERVSMSNIIRAYQGFRQGVSSPVDSRS
jgi:uncharacterized membrane protein